MEKAEKRKYAQAMRRLELGILGYKKSLFRAIHLTTREGDDNSAERFVKDFRKLIKYFRSCGYNVEYCVAMGFTPGKHLIHSHGLLRIKGGFFPVSRRELGDKWNEIHNAFAVQISEVPSARSFDNYINKHILKDYATSYMLRKHFLVSAGWRRSVPISLYKEVKEWYIEGRGSGSTWMDKAGWVVVNLVIKAYCEGRNVVVKIGSGHIVVKKGKITEAVIYSVGEEAT